MKLLRGIYSLYAIITFVLTMFLIFPFAVMSSFAAGTRAGNMVFALCRLWGDLWFPLIGIFHQKIYEAPHDRNKPYIFLSNHISYLDAAVLVKAYRQPLRALGKAELSRVPVFGFIYRKAIVTVDRKNIYSRALSLRILRSILGKGISVLVFPEGTFNTTGKPLKPFYDGAFRLAIEMQTPIKPVLFLDTYSRMPYTSIFRMTPGRSRIIYLDEVCVQGLALSDLDRLKQQVFSLMEQKLIEYKAPWITPGND